MADPIPAVPQEPIVEHTSEQNFEPDNESKRLRNQMGEFAVGEPSVEPALDEEGKPIDPNVDITRQNQTAGEFPAGDEPQTPSPAPWREVSASEREEQPQDDNAAKGERNKVPEKIVGAVSADTVAPPPEEEVPPPPVEPLPEPPVEPVEE